MSDYRPNLPAAEVHVELKSALRELRRAEKSAVIWFSDVYARKLYRELGYASIQQYAIEALGFSQGKTYQFIRLADRLNELPKLRRAVTDGAVPWTKARTVAAVATPKTEKEWVRVAKTQGNRALEQSVQAHRTAMETVRQEKAGQTQLLSAPKETPPVDRVRAETAVAESPTRVSFEMTPTELARYEALIEKLRKLGVKGSKTELLLQVLVEAVEEHGDRMSASRSEARTTRAATQESDSESTKESSSASLSSSKVGGDSDDRGRFCTRVHSHSPYQVVVTVCSNCGGGKLPANGGARSLTAKTLSAVLCDARVQAEGKRNLATIPPRTRREVLARDGYTCRMKGCNRSHFLEVHHVKPRAKGGTNDAANLVTLCSGCHQVTHDLDPDAVVRATAIRPSKRDAWAATVREPSTAMYGARLSMRPATVREGSSVTYGSEHGQFRAGECAAPHMHNSCSIAVRQA